MGTARKEADIQGAYSPTIIRSMLTF
jgi:hypothetical protein